MVPRPRSAPRRPGHSRLSRSAEFERVYRHGRSRSNRYLVLYAFPRAEHAGGSSPGEAGRATAGRRLGLSVSRKVGGAVERSRVKRVLREAFAAEATRLDDDHDFVLVARPDLRDLIEREGLAGARAALTELIGRPGG